MHIVAPQRLVERNQREAAQTRAKVFWLTGPSGAGKFTSLYAFIRDAVAFARD
ncbi:MAG: hypothetical protein LBV65_03805 [Desulfovibrio sp.]|jgi:adenylylsulfate kinase-like enzyme|nr:hypothetical protein [Desulfovibrio sp.]